MWQRRRSRQCRRARNALEKACWGCPRYLRDDIGPGWAGGDERCRPGAGIIEVDRWRLRRLLVESGRSPQASEAQDQHVDRGFERRLFHLLDGFWGGTLEGKRDALENEPP